MPNFCIFEDKLISTEDVYKFNIDKNSEFMCYTCDKRLHFRQSRNADKGYTEHFYQVNAGTSFVWNLTSYGQRKEFFENRTYLGAVLLGGKKDNLIEFGMNLQSDEESEINDNL